MGQPARAPTMGVATGVVTDRADLDETGPPKTYEERKLTGWCTYGACPRRMEGWPNPTYQLCRYHRGRVNARQRRRTNKVRSENAAQGKCRTCGKPSATYRCPKCKIEDGANLPSMGVATRVATDSKDPWRRDNDGWQRYRGKGQRGAPPAIDNDLADLNAAVDALERGRQSLIYAHALNVAESGKRGKQAAKAAAAGILAMGARFIADVVERNTGERPALSKKERQPIEDEGGEDDENDQEGADR